MDRKKRELLLFCIIGVLTGFWLVTRLVFSPFHARLAGLGKEVLLQEARLKKGYGLIENKDVINTEYEKYASYFSLLNFSDEETVASFLKEVEKMGRESSLAILDMKPQKEVTGDKFSKQYQISIRAEASLQQLVDFLYALYNSPLLFSVEKLVLTPKGEGATTLSVTMAVVGVSFL